MTVTVSQGYEPTSDIMVADAVPLNDLDHNQLDTIATWAGGEMISIAQEAAPVMANTADTDVYEEITESNTKEAKRLSIMLDQWKREGIIMRAFVISLALITTAFSAMTPTLFAQQGPRAGQHDDMMGLENQPVLRQHLV